MAPDYLKTFPQYILPKRSLTTLSGLLANVKIPAVKNHLIRQFIRKYNVNMNEALEQNPTHYASFNEFFIRRLKPECRPISNVDVVSPVDGFVSEFGGIYDGQLLQAKGRSYSVNTLLGAGQEMSDAFSKGLFATLYLSPKDYHRVHMPLSATVKSMVHVPGRLFSVQPATARVIPYLFARNERVVVLFETTVGLMAMVLVGATIVGRIGITWHGELQRGKQAVRYYYPESSNQTIALSKGDEMGYFKLGSTVVLLFADAARVQWMPSIQSGHPIHFGQPLAEFKSL